MLHHPPLQILIETTYNPTFSRFPDVNIATIDIDLSPYNDPPNTDKDPSNTDNNSPNTDNAKFEAKFTVTLSMPRDFKEHGDYQVKLIRCSLFNEDEMNAAMQAYTNSKNEPWNADNQEASSLQILEWKDSDGVEGLVHVAERGLGDMRVGQEFLAAKHSISSSKYRTH
jgi:hypothetical protein